MRLAKYIAHQGYCSRRRAEELITQGTVEVNGVRAEITTPINPERDTVTIEGNNLQPEEPVYIMLHKSAGVLSTCRSGREKGLTVLDIVQVPQRVYPVGRLDKNSTGLILLTNDGKLAYALTHPSQEVEKEYIIELNRPFTPSDIKCLIEGINLDGTLCRFHRLKEINKGVYRVVLKQGLKRQIRRMAEIVGKRVIKLKRTREDTLSLGNLPEGKWRYLTSEEISKLIAIL